MKTRTTIQIGFTLFLCLAFFGVGWISGSRSVPSYSVDQMRVAFHRDWPVYGLPLVDNALVLTELRNGDSKRALAHLEFFLDSAIYSAEHRRPILRGWQLSELDKALARAARYREQFPRPVSQSQGRDSYGTADRQTEIDTFLRGFAKKGESR